MTMPTSKTNTLVLPPSVESFLAAIESKTDIDAHRRLLRAARSDTPLEAMNVELAKIANEILNAT